MKIALVVNSSWNIFNFRRNLLIHLRAIGHEIITIAPEDKYSDSIRAEFTFIPVPVSPKGINPFQDLHLLWTLYKLYKKHKPDCILHYTIKPNIYGTIAAALAGIPSINTVSGLGTVFLHNSLTSSIAIQLYKLAFSLSHKVLFQNNDDRLLFLKKKIVRPENSAVVPGSGIDIDCFRPEAFKVNESFTFLLVARLLYDKGIVEYAEAAKIVKRQFPDTRFMLAGEFDKKTSLGIPENLIREWDREGLIEFKGFVGDIKSLMLKADVIVLPSYREGVPRTLLEAAALGKPLIATNVPGCREVVKDKYNGFLCQLKNIHDLAGKMSEIKQLNPHDLKRMAANSRTLAEENFSENRVFDVYESIIVNLTKEHD